MSTSVNLPANKRPTLSFIPFTRFCDRVVKLRSDGKPFKLAPHQRTIDINDLVIQETISQIFYGDNKEKRQNLTAGNRSTEVGFGAYRR